jgi:hypothetical protein
MRVSPAIRMSSATSFGVPSARCTALRFLAGEADDELLGHVRQQESHVVWETTERILVAVTAELGTGALMPSPASPASVRSPRS